MKNPRTTRMGCPVFLALLVVLVCGCGLLEEDTGSNGGSADKGSTPDCRAGWAASVEAFTPGQGATHGQSRMPDIVLGPSSGTGDGAQSLDVLSLGSGGSITLSFAPGCCVVDGPGDDLAVMENVFFIAGNPDNRFIEAARVAVSQNNVDFFEFPTFVDDQLPLGHPHRYSGFAGVEPVYPGDTPADVGGDRFDLEDLGLSWIRYVRITDAGGDPMDPGDIVDGGYGMDGFDLDAVGAIHYGSGDECR